MNIHQGKQFVSEPQPNTVLQGDCVEVMRRFRSCSVNFVLTDPPYLAHYCSRECTYKMLFEIGRAPSVETIDCASSPPVEFPGSNSSWNLHASRVRCCQPNI
jgi:hypothetical protein